MLGFHFADEKGEANEENYGRNKANVTVNNIGRKRKSNTAINVEADSGKKFKMNVIEMKLRELCRKLSLLRLGVSSANDTKVLI